MLEKHTIPKIEKSDKTNWKIEWIECTVDDMINVLSYTQAFNKAYKKACVQLLSKAQ